MSHRSHTVLLLTLILLLTAAPTFAQRGSGHGSPRASSSYRSGGYSGGFAGNGGYGFGGYSDYSALGAPQTYLPNYWWVSPYPLADPRQDGYNPSAGYEWDSVGTLILNTNPPQARVTLDGIYAGTTDKLGPFQLPVGEHTLHIEAPGYEPTDVVVKFDKPGVQTLDLGLKRLTASAKPAPRP
jgi:hypothetical protein